MPFIKEAMTERETTEGPKTIVKLAAKAYVEESGSSKSTLDAKFIDMAVSQLKMFIFAGHDTTAMTLCYMYHMLFTHPRCLAAVRAELDEVLGKDLGQAETVICESPHLLNALPYTQAVIKETLRMYAPVGGVRQGGKDFFLTHPETGQKYPTEGWMLFANSMASHRLEENCPEPDIFKPERWLKNEAPIKKNAFRPFELGARNCIGQELAQVELRAILALTIREFDLESAYDPDGPKVLGEVAYQRMVPGDLTAKPIGGMPMRVRTRA
jgi:cytochrome P450